MQRFAVYNIVTFSICCCTLYHILRLSSFCTLLYHYCAVLVYTELKPFVIHVHNKSRNHVVGFHTYHIIQILSVPCWQTIWNFNIFKICSDEGILINGRKFTNSWVWTLIREYWTWVDRNCKNVFTHESMVLVIYCESLTFHFLNFFLEN